MDSRTKADLKSTSSDDLTTTKAYEASPAELEDAVFGGANEEGPNYQNVITAHVSFAFFDTDVLIPTGRMAGSVCIDDEDSSRSRSLVSSRHFSHSGYGTRCHYPGIDCCHLDM